jgi:CarD family transcriptional regulator
LCPLYGLSPGSRENLEQGRGQFHAQAVSQKTRKKSISKGSRKAAAVSRNATKSRVRTSVKDPRKAAKTPINKASAAKSSKNKRSAMPNKTAKTAAKATVAKATASKVAASKNAAKAPGLKAP